MRLYNINVRMIHLIKMSISVNCFVFVIMSVQPRRSPLVFWIGMLSPKFLHNILR